MIRVLANVTVASHRDRSLAGGAGGPRELAHGLATALAYLREWAALAARHWGHRHL